MAASELMEYVRREENAVEVTDIRGENARTLFTLHENEDLACGTERVPPGSQVPFHKHEKAGEMLYCTAGTGRIILENKETYHECPFVPGVMACVPRGIRHCIVNDGNTELCLVWAISPPQKVAKFRAKL